MTLLEIFIRAIVLALVVLLILKVDTVLYKARLTIHGISYLLFCHDKSWKKPADPILVFKPLLESEEGKKKIERKTIIFVRHGESTWNDTFNKGSHRSAIVFAIGYIPGLVKAFLYESYLVLSGKMDSWFYDSPLSHLGHGQVDKLAKFLGEESKKITEKEEEILKIMRGDAGAPESKIVCSILRRALSTMAASFRDRLQRRPSESILILPSLQEISRNPDSLTLTPAHIPVTASWIDKESHICDFQSIFTKQVDMELHTGNKPIDTNGLKRMNDFCNDVFSPLIPEDNVIVGGHSIWFRSFFQTFLPYEIDHVSKKRKVINAGCVAFTLMKTCSSDGDRFMIDSNSIQVVYGGF